MLVIQIEKITPKTTKYIDMRKTLLNLSKKEYINYLIYKGVDVEQITPNIRVRDEL